MVGSSLDINVSHVGTGLLEQSRSKKIQFLTKWMALF